MPFIELYRDDFSDGTVGLHQAPGNGSISEVGGGLTVSLSEGVNGSWWNTDYLAPVASIENIGELYTSNWPERRRSSRLHMIETRVVNFIRYNVYCYAGLCLWAGRGNYINVGWYPNDSKVYVQKNVGSANSATLSPSPGGPVGDPSIIAHKYAIIWNPTPYALANTYFSVYLDQNRAALYYSVDDGITWQWTGVAYTFEFDIGNIRGGVFVRNWDGGSGFPSTSVTFDYLSFKLVDADMVHTP